MTRLPEPTRQRPPAPADRWALLRDLTVFQGKLFLDGFRDLALSPVSLAAALADLVVGGDRFGRFFYGVMLAGRRTERWIDLFGAVDRRARGGARASSEDTGGLDALVERLEAALVEQHARGGMTASARARIDRLLDAVERRPRA